MTAPVRARLQRLDALEKANRVRIGMAHLKRDIAAGHVTILDALEDPRAETVHIAVLLRTQPGWGWVRAQRTLARLMISEHRRVGDLTERQRRQLARVLSRPGAHGRGALERDCGS